MQSPVKLKGIREGLFATLSVDYSWEEASNALLVLFDYPTVISRSVRLALATGQRFLEEAELIELRTALSFRNVDLWAVITEDLETKNRVQALGLMTELPIRGVQNHTETEIFVCEVKTQQEAEPEINPEEPGEEALMVHRTLRSGRSVNYEGHVVILGDVNPGAEVMAGGDIIVWGRLRGLAHAGMYGNENALVCALDLCPIQLRIAGYIATSPKRKGEVFPEIARLKEGIIVAESWTARVANT